jgi:putative endonuclease
VRKTIGVAITFEPKAIIPPVPAFYCYIVECADGTYYTGWSTDPARRLRQHAAGRGARYTRAHRPTRLVFVELQPDRATAMRRERALKAMSRARKQSLIAEAPPSEALS